MKLLVPAGGTQSLYTIRGPVYVEPSTLVASLQSGARSSEVPVLADLSEMQKRIAMAETHRHRTANAPLMADAPVIVANGHRYRLDNAPQTPIRMVEFADQAAVEPQRYLYRMGELATPLPPDSQRNLIRNVPQLREQLAADAGQRYRYRMGQLNDEAPLEPSHKIRYRLAEVLSQDAPSYDGPIVDPVETDSIPLKRAYRP